MRLWGGQRGRCPSLFQRLKQREEHVALFFIVVRGLARVRIPCLSVNFLPVPVPREWVSRLSYWLSQRSSAWSSLQLSIENGVRLYYKVNISAETKGWKSHRKNWEKSIPERGNAYKSPKLWKALNVWGPEGHCASDRVSRGRWSERSQKRPDHAGLTEPWPWV